MVYTFVGVARRVVIHVSICAGLDLAAPYTTTLVQCGVPMRLVWRITGRTMLAILIFPTCVFENCVSGRGAVHYLREVLV